MVVMWKAIAHRNIFMIMCLALFANMFRDSRLIYLYIIRNSHHIAVTRWLFQCCCFFFYFFILPFLPISQVVKVLCVYFSHSNSSVLWKIYCSLFNSVEPSNSFCLHDRVFKSLLIRFSVPWIRYDDPTTDA